jgi:hypothetical protein
MDSTNVVCLESVGLRTYLTDRGFVQSEVQKKTEKVVILTCYTAAKLQSIALERRGKFR